MHEQNGDITVASLAIFILAAAQENSIEYAFSPYLWTYTDEICAPYYLKEFRESMAQFGKPSFLTEGASHFVKRQRKKHQWVAEAAVEMLTELRYVMSVLAKTPLLVDTGQYVPQMRQRSYQDQENLIANELSSLLPNYHAKVRLLTREHTIKTRPAPTLVSEPEVEARIRAIKERMLSLGYTRPARAIEEEVAKRHEALRQRPPDVVPQIHTTGRRSGRQKGPGSP
jgi:hypothetical protein